MICRMDVDKFFGILIFKKNGNIVCMMDDFQNALISRIFSVFWSSFLHRTTLNHLKNGF